MTVLALSGVGKSYWRGRHEVAVLHDVSLDVGRGEVVAVLGSRAAGKTTLLRIACGVERPDRGTVAFQGRELTARGRSPRIAGLPRDLGWIRRGGPAIRSMAMLDHLALPLLADASHRAAERRAMRALADAGIPEVATARWAELSDTERMLVAIARAAIRDPALLLADDPAAGLGMVDRERVLGVLRRAVARTGTAVLMAVSDVPELLGADRVLSLSGGELLSAKRPEADVIPLRRAR